MCLYDLAHLILERRKLPEEEYGTSTRGFSATIAVVFIVMSTGYVIFIVHGGYWYSSQR